MQAGKLPDDLDQHGHGILGVHIQAEQFGQLADDQDHGHAVEIPDQHRPGEVVGHPAQADHPGDQEAGPHQEG